MHHITQVSCVSFRHDLCDEIRASDCPQHGGEVPYIGDACPDTDSDIGFPVMSALGGFIVQSGMDVGAMGDSDMESGVGDASLQPALRSTSSAVGPGDGDGKGSRFNLMGGLVLQDNVTCDGFGDGGPAASFGLDVMGERSVQDGGTVGVSGGKWLGGRVSQDSGIAEGVGEGGLAQSLMGGSIL